MLPFDFGDKRMPARFWSKVLVTDAGCWEWQAAQANGGYGYFKWGPGMRLAHRAAYETLVGSVENGLHLDHLCRVRRCVNPYHLEPVTPRENTLRGVGTAAIHAKKTHCPAGHEYSGNNLILR